VLALLTRVRLAQSVAGEHRAMVSAFLKERGLQMDLRETFARYLNTNMLAVWRLIVLARYSDAEYGRWVRMEGYEDFLKLREAGRPVLLAHSHYGSGKTVLLTLIRLGHVIHSLDRQDVFGFYDIRAKGKIVSIHLGRGDENSFLLKQVFRARNALKEGGILHVAADGVRGSLRAFPFLGRQRMFPSSVAEFAIATGAAVVPVFGTLELDGHIRVEFMSPMTPPATELSHEDKILHYIAQYAAALEAHWLVDPGQVFKSEYRIYRGLPRVAEATSSQSGATQATR
jgi:lauroyl/myristoyl acyltransferase